VDSLAGRIDQEHKRISDVGGPLFFAPPDAVRDRLAIIAQLRSAVAGATLRTDPSPHIVIDEVLPHAYSWQSFDCSSAQAAHGADLPIDAPLRERYACQFYVTPVGLKTIVNLLPDAERAHWEGLAAIMPESQAPPEGHLRGMPYAPSAVRRGHQLGRTG
jgi:hypothetical protein